MLVFLGSKVFCNYKGKVMYYKLWILCGSILSMVAVVLGAFAAHFLKTRLSSELLQTFEVGVRYQMYHSFALFFIAFLSNVNNSWVLTSAGISFCSGIIFFSGSLYLLSFGFFSSWVGPLTPIGGGFFILGWLFLASSVFFSHT